MATQGDIPKCFIFETKDVTELETWNKTNLL